MLDLLKEESNRTWTENGALAKATSGSDCLDLFATIGALRNEGEEEILSRFIRAYTENADLAMKILFYARDIRGGLGERRTFRVIFSWLATQKPESVEKNLNVLAEFGRFDDFLILFDTPCEKKMLAFLQNQFQQDLEQARKGGAISLLAKWLPSVNASSPQTVRFGKRIAKAFGMREASYRKALSMLRKKLHVLERDLSAKDYSFDYAKQPSRAMFQYKDAFFRNDGERYQAFLSQVSTGNCSLHTEQICPYELVEACMEPSRSSMLKSLSREEEEVLNVSWEALPDYAGEEDVLAVIDNSASMYCDGSPRPASVALSLGLYLAERNRGKFAGHYMEFSRTPQLIQVKGKTFTDRLRYASTFHQVADTNLEEVFQLLLRTAVTYQLKQKDLPGKLVILSDMEFNACVTNASATNFEQAKNLFEEHGYHLPQILFWNVASRNRQQPVTENEEGVMLLSGVTPKLFQIAAGTHGSPYTFMTDILSSQRYARISA